MADSLDASDDAEAERAIADASLRRVGSAILTASYRDGLDDGEATALQAGFDAGFERAAVVSFVLGQLLGGLRGATAVRPEIAPDIAAEIERCSVAAEAMLKAVATDALEPPDTPASSSSPGETSSSSQSGLRGSSDVVRSLPGLCAAVEAVLRAAGLSAGVVESICAVPPWARPPLADAAVAAPAVPDAAGTHG